MSRPEQRLFDPSSTRTPHWTDEVHELDLSERRLQERQQAALDATSRWWREEAEAALERLAATRMAPWTAEDLREEVGDAPGPSQNAFGALFAAAARAGTIRPVGWTTASRPAAAGRGLRTWIGTEVAG